MFLLQTPDLGTTASSITVVGLLFTAVIALYLGQVTPKHTVEELRGRLKEREAENAALNADVIKRIEENAQLRGELMGLRHEMENLREELAALRRELVHYREAPG
jgi:predicted RNase H-like nuclease (RuvC/YqgF family)